MAPLSMQNAVYDEQAERAERPRGPRILEMPAETTVTAAEHEQKARDEGKTGIRRSASGAWVAVVDGRLAGAWSGAGSKLRAIRAAGTNTVLA